MRKLIRITAAALAAAAALGGAGIASADPGDQGYYGRGGYSDYDRETPYRTNQIRNQLDELAERINRSDGRGRLSEREAWGLRREIGRTREQLRWMNRDGLDHRELRTLQARIDHIRIQLRGERRDGDGYWGGRRG